MLVFFITDHTKPDIALCQLIKNLALLKMRLISIPQILAR